MWKIVGLFASQNLAVRRKQGACVYLRFVCTCAHDPLPIIADPDTLARLFEFEVLKQLYAIGVLGVVLQTSLSLPRKPFWKWPGSR